MVGEARPAVNTKALSRRGRDNVVHNPVITTPLLWLAFIKLRRGGFFKVGKLLARQRRLHLPKSFDENGEGRVYVCGCAYVRRLCL